MAGSKQIPKQKLIIHAAEAARILGVAPETVQYRMEKAQWPIGKVYKARGKGKKKTYDIYWPLFAAYFGLKGNYHEVVGSLFGEHDAH